MNMIKINDYFRISDGSEYKLVSENECEIHGKGILFVRNGGIAKAYDGGVARAYDGVTSC